MKINIEILEEEVWISIGNNSEKLSPEEFSKVVDYGTLVKIKYMILKMNAEMVIK